MDEELRVRRVGGSSGPTLLTAMWVGAQHAVAVGAALAVLGAVTGRAAPLAYGEPALWAVAWVGVAWQLRSILRRIGSFRWWTWALFPAPLLAFDVVFARSAALTVVRRSVRWRGRRVRPQRTRVRRGRGLMLRLVMPQALTVVVDVIAWGVFHAVTGYAAYRPGDAG